MNVVSSGWGFESLSALALTFLRTLRYARFPESLLREFMRTVVWPKYPAQKRIDTFADEIEKTARYSYGLSFYEL